LSALSDRRTNGALSADEQCIREEILAGLIQDKGGDAQIGTATRILAEVIASDAAWLIAFNKAQDAVMASNQKARGNPAALAKLDGYKRGLVNSLTGNLQRFGFDKVAKVETLREIMEEMADQDETSGETNTTQPRGDGPCRLTKTSTKIETNREN